MIRILLILVLVGVLAWAFWRFIDGIIDTFGGTSRRRKATPMKLVRDPYCGTWVPPDESLALRSGNETHYFCSAECRESFRKSA